MKKILLIACVLFLAIANEGTDVARWLNQKGVTVFILNTDLHIA